MQVNGGNESYALLQISAAPPPIEAFAGLGTHAIAFAGEVAFEWPGPVYDFVKQQKEALDDPDNEFSWDLDIRVGPAWRSVKTAAPLVAVTKVHSNNADEDDSMGFGVTFKSPRWTVEADGGAEKIILHVTIMQAGEYLEIQRLGYSVTATGDLRKPAEFVP